MLRQQAKRLEEYQRVVADLQAELLELRKFSISLEPPLHDDILEMIAITSGSVPPVVSPYQQALRMVRQGVPVSNIASQCGISRSEAELLRAVFRRMG